MQAVVSGNGNGWLRRTQFPNLFPVVRSFVLAGCVDAHTLKVRSGNCLRRLAGTLGLRIGRADIRVCTHGMILLPISFPIKRST